MRTLPVVAERLLQAFDIPRRNQFLMGDLVEEYCHGRSVLWLWRQTLSAVVLTLFRDVRTHRLLIPGLLGLGVATQLSWYAVAAGLHSAPYWRTAGLGSEHAWWDAVSVGCMLLWRAGWGWLAGWAGPRRVRGALAIGYPTALAGLDLMRLAVALSSGTRFIHSPSTSLVMLAAAWLVTLAAGLHAATYQPLKTV